MRAASSVAGSSPDAAIARKDTPSSSRTHRRHSSAPKPCRRIVTTDPIAASEKTPSDSAALTSASRRSPGCDGTDAPSGARPTRLGCG